jgi:hypothetical protein
MAITRLHKFLDVIPHCRYNKNLLSKQLNAVYESCPKKYHPVRDSGNSCIRNSGSYLVFNALCHKKSQPRFSQGSKMFTIKPNPSLDFHKEVKCSLSNHSFFQNGIELSIFYITPLLGFLLVTSIYSLPAGYLSTLFRPPRFSF